MGKVRKKSRSQITTGFDLLNSRVITASKWQRSLALSARKSKQRGSKQSAFLEIYFSLTLGSPNLHVKVISPRFWHGRTDVHQSRRLTILADFEFLARKRMKIPAHQLIESFLTKKLTKFREMKAESYLEKLRIRNRNRQLFPSKS